MLDYTWGTVGPIQILNPSKITNRASFVSAVVHLIKLTKKMYSAKPSGC